MDFRVKRFSSFSLVCVITLVLLGWIYGAVFLPAAISLFVTYLLGPLVQRFERYNVPRGLIVTVLLLFTFLLLGLGVFVVVPALYTQVMELIANAPRMYHFVFANWIIPLRQYLLELNIIDEVTLNQLVAELSRFEKLPDRMQNALTTILNTAPQVFGLIIHIVLIPPITFVLLKDAPSIKARLFGLVPEDLRKPFSTLLSRCDTMLRSVIQGQLLVAAILTVLYVIGFSLVGLHASVSIGLIAGICRIIPYLDIIIGAVLSAFAIFSNFEGVGQFFAAAGVIGVIQALDGMLITPRVIGERIGLHPMIVILSVLAFAELMGFWGVFLAIPIVALAKVLWLSFEAVYLSSAYYHQEKRAPKQS